MTTIRPAGVCSRSDCYRPAAVTIRDGRTYCKRHGDHLPPYLRHRPPRKAVTP